MRRLRRIMILLLLLLVIQLILIFLVLFLFPIFQRILMVLVAVIVIGRSRFIIAVVIAMPVAATGDIRRGGVRRPPSHIHIAIVATSRIAIAVAAFRYSATAAPGKFARALFVISIFVKRIRSLPSGGSRMGAAIVVVIVGSAGMTIVVTIRSSRRTIVVAIRSSRRKTIVVAVVAVSARGRSRRGGRRTRRRTPSRIARRGGAR
mmetsp:Transcript_33829/g.71108  ORF Transcript_33829/g.71108 Transcript_33829/m.71108 type:complete len:205 (-) Transcript_33829:600-1214(-)